VVKTNDLINDLEKLLATHKELCLVENSVDSLYFKEASKNTLAYRILMKTNINQICYLRDGKEIRIFGEKGYSNYFTIASEFVIKVASDMLMNLNQKDSFTSDKYYLEILRAFYLRKGLSREIRNYFDLW